MKDRCDTDLARKQIEQNLERVYVMEQRQFITMKLEADALPVRGLEAYSLAVNAFNEAFDAHRCFEEFYLADPARKTRANALILDDKYALLMEKFACLKPLLLSAKALLEE